MFPCPCCGFETLDEKSPGTFGICAVCDWEDDNVQFADPDFPGGANRDSLRQFQKQWLKSASVGEAEIVIEGRRYRRDPNWRPLGPAG